MAGHVSGLDMSGTISETYDVLYDFVTPNNFFSYKNYKIVNPGNPYTNFFFNKKNYGFGFVVNFVYS